MRPHSTTPLRNLLQLHPLVPIAACFAFGVAMGNRFCNPEWWPWLLGAFVALLALAVLCLRRPQVCSALLLLVATVGGSMAVAVANVRADTTLPEGQNLYEAVVADEPTATNGTTVRADLIIASGHLAGRTVRCYFAIDTITNRHAALCVGTGVSVSTQLRKPTNRHDSRFDYTTYLKSHGIVATAYASTSRWQFATVALSDISISDRAHIALMRLRHDILQRCARLGLSPDALAIASAMTLGDKSAITSGVREAYSATGVAHILALSGMHIGIIYSLLALLVIGRRHSAVRELLLMAAVWGYVAVVGMPPSAVRAALMITVYSIVGLTERRRAPLNVLAFAALLMLVANPLVLFDIGFQLSFTAVAFILVFHSPLSSLVPVPFQRRHHAVRFVWQLVVLSVVATAGTMPLVACHFGRLPVYFIVANLAVVPAAMAIVYGFIAIAALSPVPVASQWLAHTLSVFVSWLNGFLLWVSSWPYATIAIPPLSTLQVALLYVAVVSMLSSITILIRRRYMNRVDIM